MDMPSELEVQSGEESVDMDRNRIVVVEREEEEDGDVGSVITDDDSIGDSSGEDDIFGVGNYAECSVEKLELPEEFAKSVMVLTCESTAEGGSCDVYLVGTAHVSQESCREVEAVISALKPQVVFVELCISRMSLLEPQTSKEVPTVMEMIGMWKRDHNLFGIVYGWLLAKIAKKLEVVPGAEFRVACEAAEKYGGKVFFGDRPVQVTLMRTWGKMPLWHKIKLVYSIVSQAVFLPKSEELEKTLKDMNDVDMLTSAFQDMSKKFPSLMETLVHERDLYMSYSLLQVASEHRRVVAVVGRGHLEGIKKKWNQLITIEELMGSPINDSTYTMKNVLRYLVVVVAGVAIIAGIYLTK
ncbi:traB domain-containing protein [Capsella rubella]|uniref:traB domain-containing protein n=1 Tax=Capsella rubella TaxID=81985 RepID=UPI000CD52053|nr:traB domain-containing protein [Capsella rubella]